MIEITCYYHNCEFNKAEKYTLSEIAISGNITCMTSISKEEAAKIKAED